MFVSNVFQPYNFPNSRLIHGGQILNGLAGPTVMNAAPFLSTTWFSADERATATAIASMLSYLGGACAFLVGPLLVPAPNGTSPLLAAESSRAHIKDRIETVLYAGTVELFFFPCFLWYPFQSLLSSSGMPDLITDCTFIILYGDTSLKQPFLESH